MCFDLCSGELLSISERELKLVGGVHASSLSPVIQTSRLPHTKCRWGSKAEAAMCALTVLPQSSSNVGEFYRPLLLDAAFSSPYYNSVRHGQSVPNQR